MTKHAVTDLAASVHQRLRNLAARTDRPFDELFQRYAMERFLHRLSRSPHAGRFVLKGALMLAVWDAPMSRPTMDIDLLGRMRNDVDSVLDVVRDVCVMMVEPDGMAFDPNSVRGVVIKEDAEYSGVRATARGNLGVSRVQIQIDVGFGDVIVPCESEIVFPTLLDMPAPILQGYSRESVVAEKFEAAVKLDLRNTRMRDIYDLGFLSRQFPFDAVSLSHAIRATFANRGTDLEANPTIFAGAFADNPAKAALWRAFTARMRIPRDPGGLAGVIDAVATFLRPIMASLVEARAFEADWPPGGPWRERKPAAK
ncbi:MAG: nucleotidyl transferase AbiEii/AbiGii toxin family protein [Deltaproteobacteria bacterium]|nr:nucleotidyl transferase AbiEii/AbiGii toxin family protein [Deltaproteobacteria bacterium]